MKLYFGQGSGTNNFKSKYCSYQVWFLDKDKFLRIYFQNENSIKGKILTISTYLFYSLHCMSICVCLSILSRSPKVYDELKAPGMLKLLRGCLPHLYKSCGKQSPGFLSDNLQWMMAEADRLRFGFGCPEWWCGGIATHEMSIQIIMISSYGQNCICHPIGITSNIPT